MSEDLETQAKRQVERTEEATTQGKYYTPATDIYETETELTVVMEMPGVAREDVDITLEKGRLAVEGRIDFSAYEGLKPAYTEYNVGHFVRAFTLSSKIDQEKISADMQGGVLTLRLPKVEEAQPRRIVVA